MNDTIIKFNYPESLIKEYDNWVLLIRNEQVTLGSLILAYKDNVDAFSKVNREGYLELEIIIKEVEKTLKRVFNNNKINYLTLMMVDNEVHMHIIPRYSSLRKFNNKSYFDPGWPVLPDLKYINYLDNGELMYLKDYLKNILKK